jgi:hypothetical protein
MGLKGPLQCSQVPATGPHPEPDEFNPKLPSHFFKMLILSLLLCVRIPVVFFFQIFITEVSVDLSPICATHCVSPLIDLTLLIFCEYES